MRISNAKQLNNLLPRDLKKGYSIGMHGFDGYQYWDKDENGNYVPNVALVNEVKQSILDNGLRINGERNLLSTVSFEALDKYVQTSGYYTLGGVIVAIPNSIKTEDGKEMFLGSPNENSKHYEGKHWDRNRQATSYAETVLVKDGTLPPEFILGTYTKDDDGIDVTLNERHLSKTGNVVSQEEYKEIQTRMSKLIKDGTINTIVIKEMLDQKKNLRKSRGFGILGKIREMRGTREGKNEVGKIFDSWRQKSKEKETIEGRVEETEDGIR